MAYWLLKSEPSSWSWDEQVAAGRRRTLEERVAVPDTPIRVAAPLWRRLHAVVNHVAAACGSHPVHMHTVQLRIRYVSPGSSAWPAQASPLSTVRRSASAFMCATMSTVPLRLSATTQVTRPCSSKRGVKPVSNRVLDSEGPPDFWASAYAKMIGTHPAPGFPTAQERAAP